VDEGLLKLYVDNGYSVLMIDYRGRYEGVERFTTYPENISYANLKTCGRSKDYVDESADKTCWYEWVAVGIYARKYLISKLNTPNVGIIGLRDGGDVAWKLISVAQFSCAVTVCSVGWRAYTGFSKFSGEEPAFDDERYRFVAGIDCQSYAPYVKCPVLMLCATNDYRIDYDRAFDTFSRINPEHAQESVIAYSVNSNDCIGTTCITDMFMFLDSFVKQRHVFIPKPADISIGVDDEQNLVAKASFDNSGIVEKYGVFVAEDCKHSALRDWVEMPYKKRLSETEHEFYLNVYEKTNMIFAMAYVTYSNGFTVWSKIMAKKVSGRFKNSQPKCKVIYSNKYNIDCFSVADDVYPSVGGMFLVNGTAMPQIVTKAKDIAGIYSVGGLSTYRLNNPKFAPDKDGILKFDICPDYDTTLDLLLRDVIGGTEFFSRVSVLGGVWQSVLLKSKMFKNSSGASLNDFSRGFQFTIYCKEPFAVNNVLWL
jgi:hypothetical protein